MNLHNTDWLRHLVIQTVTQSSEQIQAEALIVIGSKTEWEQGVYDVPGHTYCQDAVHTGLYKADPQAIQVVPVREGQIQYLIAVGRKESALTAHDLRNLMATAAKQALKLGAKKIAVRLPNELIQISDATEIRTFAHALTEGFLLGCYQRVTYKKDAKPIHAIETITLCGEGIDAVLWQQ